ncbi:MAG: cation:proton antiporter [Nanobdellota archaeon]
MDILFLDIGLMVIIATISALLARYFRQPLIPAYIFAGLAIGPGLEYLTNIEFLRNIFMLPENFSLISNREIINTLSEIGIAFLLFIVGMEIDFKKLKNSGKVSIYGALIQSSILFLFGMLIANLMGVFTFIESIYLGLVVSFSSTMVVLKILSDRKEINTLHGRIVIGILLVEDILAIIAMIFLNAIGNSIFFKLFIGIILSFFLIFLAFISAKFIFPKLFKFAAKSHETLLLLGLSVCFVFGILFSAAGYSIAIGSFIAGIVLGNLPYNYEIMGRIKSLRDFFATLFFVSLGLQIVPGHLKGMLFPLVIFLAIVFLMKPFIIMLLMFIFGYKKRTSLISALTLTQTSEFALIILTQGMILGHISSRIFSMAVLLTVITIILSSYLIKYEYNIYNFFYKDLCFFEKVNTHEDHLEYNPKELKHEVLLVGYSRTGYNIFHKLKSMKKEFFVVDYNPDIIKNLIKEKIPCLYGDISNPDIISKVNFKDLKFVISTIPDTFASKLIIKRAKKENKDIVVFVTSYNVDDALLLYDEGADYVILPHFLGGYHASVLLEETSDDITKIIKTKAEHVKELSNRKSLGHSYPNTKKYHHDSYHKHHHK